MRTTSLRRIAVTSAFVFACSRLAWSQKIDLEAVGLEIVPIPASPGWFDLTPVIAGRVSADVTDLKIPYHVVSAEGTVIESGVIILLYPSSGQCVPPPPFHCDGACEVKLKLSSTTPFVSAPGDCIAVASGGCWCSFAPIDLLTFSRKLGCKDVTFVLDPLDTIQELDESNNTWTTKPPVSCPCEEAAGSNGNRRPKELSPRLPRPKERSVLSEFPGKPKPIRPLEPMVYDYAARKVERHGTPRKRFSASYCYVNTDTSGFFFSTTFGTEFMDWGILGGTATTKCCGLSDIVSSFTFAYATSTLDTSVAGPGAALTVTFYTNFTGFCADSGLCPVASFAFTGMPGTSGASIGGAAASYVFSVDLSGGFEFCMPDGRFGYGYRGDGNTGPLLCFAGDGAGGPEPCTGNLPLNGGQVLLCIDAGHGELLTGAGLAAFPTGIIVGGCPEFAASAPVPKNLTLNGLAFSVQALLFGPPPFALSNACDLTVGG